MDRQRIIYRPATLEAFLNRISMNPEIPGPLRQRLGYSAKIKTNICAGIVLLLGACGPVAIVRYIVAVVVAALDGMLIRRPWTNVSNEGVELHPSLANRYTPPAIITVTLCAWIIAAALHLRPAIVSNLSALRSAQSKCCVSARMTLKLPIFSAQVPHQLSGPLAASAYAFKAPYRTPGCAMHEWLANTYYGPASKAIPDNYGNLDDPWCHVPILSLAKDSRACHG